jgi:hypothetical protein
VVVAAGKVARCGPSRMNSAQRETARDARSTCSRVAGDDRAIGEQGEFRRQPILRTEQCINDLSVADSGGARSTPTACPCSVPARQEKVAR